jgi:hypothetical protein
VACLPKVKNRRAPTARCQCPGWPPVHDGPGNQERGLLRQIDMKEQAQWLWAGTAALVVMAVTVGACGSSPQPSRPAVPPEFRAACGHRGAHVTVRKVPVTISHAACDLTGVVITYPGYGGATIPRGRGGIGVGNSLGFTLTVHRDTLDVTVNATGSPSNG